jgi:hypothetical protein
VLSFIIDNNPDPDRESGEKSSELGRIRGRGPVPASGKVTAARCRGVARPSTDGAGGSPLLSLTRASALHDSARPGDIASLQPHLPSSAATAHANQMNSWTLLSEADDDGSAGMVMVSGEGLPSGRVYMCDPVNHVIDVLDDAAHPLFSFGGFGTGPGQFDTPVDLAVVPTTDDPALAPLTDALLVVADRGNHRVQLMTLDGVWLLTIDTGTSGPRSGWPVRTGWPYFHLGLSPCVPFPSRLQWRDPFLDVSSSVGGGVRMDLSAALLPPFEAWLRTTPRRLLRQAHGALVPRSSLPSVPDDCVRRIGDRIRGTARPRLVTSRPR